MLRKVVIVGRPIVSTGTCRTIARIETVRCWISRSLSRRLRISVSSLQEEKSQNERFRLTDNNLEDDRVVDIAPDRNNPRRRTDQCSFPRLNADPWASAAIGFGTNLAEDDFPTDGSQADQFDHLD